MAASCRCVPLTVVRVLSASTVVGAQPTGALRRVSLAARSACDDLELTTEDAVVLACSGGADSVALSLTVADHCARRGVQCFAVSVDHGIRRESADEARRVAAMLCSFGVRARAVHSIVGESAFGPEGDARSLRYRLFDVVGVELRARGFRRVVVMLGHTRDDQAETVLLRLSRGAGVGSLRSMSPVRSHGSVLLCRPLLDVGRADTRESCRQLGIDPIEDPTNALDGQWRTRSGAPLRRSAVRHVVLPALRTSLGQDPVPALARTARLAADDDDALEFYARQVWADAVVSKDAGQCSLDVTVLEGVPVAVRRRVFRRACLELGVRGGDLSERHLTSVNALIESWKGQGVVSLPGVSVVRKGRLVTLRAE